jgi:hypothetical protein
VRPDVSAADVVTLVAGVAHATALVGHPGPDLRQRYLTLLLDRLRPPPPPPGRPLTPEHLH